MTTGIAVSNILALHAPFLVQTLFRISIFVFVSDLLFIVLFYLVSDVQQMRFRGRFNLSAENYFIPDAFLLQVVGKDEGRIYR